MATLRCANYAIRNQLTAVSATHTDARSTAVTQVASLAESALDHQAKSNRRPFGSGIGSPKSLAMSNQSAIACCAFARAVSLGGVLRQ